MKLFKKSVSILLSVILAFGIVTVVPLEVSAAQASSWSGLQKEINDSDSVTVTLTADITAAESDSAITVASGKTVTIDLNGHTLSRGGSAYSGDASVITVKSGGTLTIRDTGAGGAGRITGGYAENGGAIVNSGALTVESGTITENIASDKGGAIYNIGSLTVSGGCITNNAGDNGGGIYNAEGGTVNLCGDAQLIANKSAGCGGGISNLGTLTISDDASVSFNYAYTEGGGVRNNGSMTVTGGSVSGNSAARSGSGINNYGTLCVQDTPFIEENMGDDVFLAAGKIIAVTGGLNTGARIGVSSATEKAVITEGYGTYNSANPSACFFENGSDSAPVTLSGGEVRLNTAGLAYVRRSWDAEEQTVTKEIRHLTNYTTVSDSLGSMSGDNWYVVKGSVTVDGRVNNSGRANLLLCDGATINLKEGIRNKQSMGSELNIYAQPGGTGKLNATGAYDIAAIGSDNGEKNGVINIYGGVIETAYDIGGGYKCAGGTVRIYGARVSGGAIGCGQKSATDSSVYIGVYHSTLRNAIHNGAGVLDFYNSSLDTHGLLTFSEAEVGGHEGCTQMGDINIVNSYINADSKIGRGAVIGSCADCNSGRIRIINSTVNARCVEDNIYGIGYGAAIGGGKGGRGGTIIIEKSCVVATAFTGAGIGGGEGCSGDSITITDSVVYTSTCRGGAGIGGGDHGHGGNIKITNSIVQSETTSGSDASKPAKKLGSAALAMMFEMMRLMTNGLQGSGSQAAYYHAGYIVAAFLVYLFEPTHGGAGIGGGDSGDSGDSGDITITDSDITATGGKYAAGIGGGDEGGCNDITIINSTVEATGGEYAAGIGSGDEAEKMGTITIRNSTVTASSKDEGAGIGGGNEVSNHKIIIEDSTVTATGGDYASGIGGGDDGDGGTIEIRYSTVTSTGGKDGAGIGGGEDGDGGTVEITSSTVTAAGKHYGAGIGCGEDGDSATVRIHGNSTVTATAGDSGYSTAIGKGDYVFSAPSVTTSLYNGLAVRAGSSSSDTEKYLGEKRHSAIVNSKYAKIYPCEHEHTEWRCENSSFHRYFCTDCGSWTDPVQEHTWNNDNICTVCGCSATMVTLKLVETNSQSQTVTTTVEMPKHTMYTLPESTNAPDGYEFIGWKTDSGNYYYDPGDSFQVSGDVVTALYLPVVQTEFIDSEGNLQTITARQLSPEIGYLTEGWYVAQGDIDFSDSGIWTVELSGAVHLILADGASVTLGRYDYKSKAMTVKNKYSSLNIYGQTEQTGTLMCEDGDISLASLTMHGGALISNKTVSAPLGYELVRGRLSVNSATANSNFAIRGGQFETNSFFTNVDVRIGWSELSDSVRFSNINTLIYGGFTIADGQALTDGEHIYTGTLTPEQVTAIEGKVLTPYLLHHYDKPDWRWSDDYHHATAVFTCIDDGCDYTTEVEAVVTAGELSGRLAYTAKVKLDGTAYTDTKIYRPTYFTGHSLSLNGDVCVNFYVDLLEDEVSDATVTFRWMVEDTEKTASVDIKNAEHKSNGYKASCPIAAAEMTYPITATLTVGGETVGSDTYSAVQYADVILTDESFIADYTEKMGALKYQQLAALIKSMLDYGAKAQTQFHRDEDHLANAKLTDEDTQSPYYFSPDDVTPDSIPSGASDMAAGLDDCGLQYAGSTVVFLTKTSLRHYYRVTDDDDFDAVVGSVTFNGASVDYQEKSKNIYFELTNIAAADLDERYILRIGGTAYQYSALDYVRACLVTQKTKAPMKELAKATYRYNQSANAFFAP